MIKRNEMIERLLSAEKYPLDGSFNDNLSELLIDGEGIVYPFSFVFLFIGTRIRTNNKLTAANNTAILHT